MIPTFLNKDYSTKTNIINVHRKLLPRGDKTSPAKFRPLMNNVHYTMSTKTACGAPSGLAPTNPCLVVPYRVVKDELLYVVIGITLVVIVVIVGVSVDVSISTEHPYTWQT